MLDFHDSGIKSGNYLSSCFPVSRLGRGGGFSGGVGGRWWKNDLPDHGFSLWWGSFQRLQLPHFPIQRSDSVDILFLHNPHLYLT